MKDIEWSISILIHVQIIILYIMDNTHRKQNARNVKLVDIEPIK
jgi:hypothetical protein